MLTKARLIIFQKKRDVKSQSCKLSEKHSSLNGKLTLRIDSILELTIF